MTFESSGVGKILPPFLLFVAVYLCPKRFPTKRTRTEFHRKKGKSKLDGRITFSCHLDPLTQHVLRKRRETNQQQASTEQEQKQQKGPCAQLRHLQIQLQNIDGQEEQ